MPKMEPTLPPKIAMENRVASGIRQAWRLAFALSIPIEAYPAIFMMIKYTIIIRVKVSKIICSQLPAYS